LRRFVPNFAKITKPISDILKKDQEFQWDNESKKAFKAIKQAISSAPVLVSPNYTCDSQIFSFAYDHTLAGVLHYKEVVGFEKHVGFHE
jgi:hypothetical protein